MDVLKLIELNFRNMDRLKRRVEYYIFKNEHLMYVVSSYTGISDLEHLFFLYKYKEKEKYQEKNMRLASLQIDYQDLWQDIFEEIVKALIKKKNINLSYVKKICDSRISNALRRYYLEAKMMIHKEEYEQIDHSAFSDEVILDIHARTIIENALLMIKDPKEKQYLETIAGNCSVKGYEKHFIQKNSKAESDDLGIAKKLGFDNAKKNKYVVIKKNVKKVVAEVIKNLGDVT